VDGHASADAASGHIDGGDGSDDRNCDCGAGDGHGRSDGCHCRTAECGRGSYRDDGAGNRSDDGAGNRSDDGAGNRSAGIPNGDGTNDCSSSAVADRRGNCAHGNCERGAFER
jgi:hypothetical protein